jgi:hypothetical protein
VTGTGRYRFARSVDALVQRIERATSLDPVADVVSGWVRRIVPAGPFPTRVTT